MLQEIIIILIFVTALFYIGRLAYRSIFKSSTGCASGCGKCGAVDFSKIEAQLKAKEKI